MREWFQRYKCARASGKSLKIHCIFSQSTCCDKIDLNHFATQRFRALGMRVRRARLAPTHYRSVHSPIIHLSACATDRMFSTTQISAVGKMLDRNCEIIALDHASCDIPIKKSSPPLLACTWRSALVQHSLCARIDHHRTHERVSSIVIYLIRTIVLTLMGCADYIICYCAAFFWFSVSGTQRVGKQKYRPWCNAKVFLKFKGS